MLNCAKIINLDELLFITCVGCSGRITQLGQSVVTEKRRRKALEGPHGALQRQLHLERKYQPYDDSIMLFCPRCLAFPTKRFQFSMKITVYSFTDNVVLQLHMYDTVACSFFGCTALEYVELVKRDRSLLSRLEDCLLQSVWHIELKENSNTITSMKPVRHQPSTAAIIPMLINRNQSHPGSQLRLDPSLATLF